ncbi:MAG: bile acid:sodium symporter family protein [Nitritalea sp.]
MEALDSSTLNFSHTGIYLLQVALAIIMFGIALNLNWADFRAIRQQPKAFFLGLISQWILLPLLTWLLVQLLQVPPSVALGMFLVAACPGGNVSNFMTHWAKGDTALSIAITAASTLISFVMTPLSFAFWAGHYAPAATLLRSFNMPLGELFVTIAMILLVPLLAGAAVKHRYPRLALQLSRVLQPLSIALFLLFVVLAFFGNYALFLQFIGVIFFWVLAHNGLAISAGFSLASAFGLNKQQRRTLSIETGIQNSGLALGIIFTYFGGLGGMAIIAGWWGVWHLVSGLLLSSFWHFKATAPAEKPVL